MSLLLLSLLALGGAAQAAPRTADAAPLNIGVYYEALCGDSRNFVVDQLNVTYSLVPEIVDPVFVPWGKAKVDADGVITCQHGDEECWGNRLLGCVSGAAPSQAVRVTTIACLMDKQHSLQQDGPACVAAGGLSWQEQADCAAADASYTEALQFGELTSALDPALTFVPTITLDGSQDGQLGLFTDLLNTVCAEWSARGGAKPAGCP